MSKLFTFCLILLFALSPAFAQEKPTIPQVRQMIREFEKERFANQQRYLAKTATLNQTQYDVAAYTLNLGLWPDTQLLQGSVAMEGRSKVNSLASLEIDLFSNMIVDSALQNGTALTYTHAGDLLTLQLPAPLGQNDPFAVEIFYRGNPQSGGGLGTWGWDQHQGVPMIWTLSQPYGAPAWWPCKDDPADKADSVFLNITVPNNLVVASNGLLQGITPQIGNRHTYHWEHRYPISTYLVSLAITNYAEFSNWYVSASGDSMELTYYVYPEHLNEAIEDFSVTPAMVSAYAARFGEYPFLDEKYGMAIFPWGGGMEHQTMTSYGAGLVTGLHWFDWITAHELSHMWFGDCITMKYWSHIWMNEGFASYSEALWAESQGGWPAYHDYMLSQDPGFFQGSLWIEDSLNVGALFSNTVYDKGSWALHMLRGVMGDTLFFTALKNYATDPNFYYGNATTEDFQAVCEAVYGQSLEWYFEEWVYRDGRPNYTYTWETAPAAGGYETTLTLMQSNPIPYKMPLQIRLSAGLQSADFTVWDSLSFQEFQFTSAFEPTDLAVDPDDWVLKSLTQGSTYAVGGSVIDAANSAPVPGALVVWEGPIDPNTGTSLSYGFDTTDVNGNFQFTLVSGDYALAAQKEGFLQSETVFRQVSGPVSNLTLTLSQPEAAFSLDSLGAALSQNQALDTVLLVSNLGSGSLFVQAVEGNFTNANPDKDIRIPAKLSGSNHPDLIASQYPESRKAGMIPMGGQGRARFYRDAFLRHQFPLEKLQNAPAPAQNLAADPVDSLWVQIHHDLRENPQNQFDLENIYIQDDAGLVYVKLTTYGNLVPPGNFRSNVFLDADNNAFTGLNINGLGVDYLVALGDFGGGLYAYLLWWNAGSQTFEFLGEVDYFNFSTTGKRMVFGVSKALLGNPAKVGIFINAFNKANIAPTVDYAPASHLGYLSASLEDVPWLKIEPLFGLTGAGSDTALMITIRPENIQPGYYLSGITLYSSHAGEMRKDFIPIFLDYATGIASSEPQIPTQFEVGQNYPNPFNPKTHVRFGLPTPARVKIEIFNLLGRRVYVEETQPLPAGYHLFEWNGQSAAGQEVSSGIYFYRISDGKNMAVRKMVLLR